MKIISWNVQGLKKPQVVQEIFLLKRKFNPDILFLLETLVNEKNLLRILPTLGFDFFDYVLPSDHSGGISVLWCNKSIHASVLLKEQRAIHMLLYDPVCPQMSVVSGIYAPAQVHQKPSFWTHPKDLNGVMDSPWCLIGDFNELEHANDKRGGRILSPSHFDKIIPFKMAFMVRLSNVLVPHLPGRSGYICI